MSRRQTSIASRAKASSSRIFTRTRELLAHRTGFITGRYQQRYGIETPIAATQTEYPRRHAAQPAQIGLRHRPHRQVASRCAPEVGPQRHGFDEFWGFLGGAVDYYRAYGGRADRPAARKLIHDLFHNEEPITSTRYMTDEITDHAEGLHSTAWTSRFFWKSSYNAPHWPFQPPDAAGRQRESTGRDRGRHPSTTTSPCSSAPTGHRRILTTLDTLQLTSQHHRHFHQR